LSLDLTLSQFSAQFVRWFTKLRFKQGDESTTGWSSAGTIVDERNLAAA